MMISSISGRAAHHDPTGGHLGSDGFSQSIRKIFGIALSDPSASKRRRMAVLKPVKGIFRKAMINSTTAFL
jgi:hypothetical protein